MGQIFSFVFVAFLVLIQEKKVNGGANEKRPGEEARKAEDDQHLPMTNVLDGPDKNRLGTEQGKNNSQSEMQESEQWRVNSQQWMVRLTAGSFLASVASIFISCQVWGISHHEIDLADSQAVRSVTELGIVSSGARTQIGIESAIISGVVVGQQPRVNLVFKNAGASAVYKFSAQADFYLGDTPSHGFHWRAVPRKFNGSFMVPGMNRKVLLNAPWFVTTEIRSKTRRNKDLKLFIYGEARWRDRYEREAGIPFCFYYSFISHDLFHCD